MSNFDSVALFLNIARNVDVSIARRYLEKFNHVEDAVAAYYEDHRPPSPLSSSSGVSKSGTSSVAVGSGIPALTSSGEVAIASGAGGRNGVRQVGPGLANQGNTCYANALISAIAHACVEDHGRGSHWSFMVAHQGGGSRG